MKKIWLLFIVVLLICCHGRSSNELTRTVKASMIRAAGQYTALNQSVPDSLFPRTLNEDGSLRLNRSDWWTSGFFPGSLWILYEFTGNPALKEQAMRRTGMVEKEQWNGSDHDIGFKILCSCGNGYRLTGYPPYREDILNAANTLSGRFNPAVGCIQSWGENPDRGWRFPVIVDNMMNLELLFRAARESGDSTFHDIAVSHADCTLKNHYRPDGSSYHVLSYDPVTGTVQKKNTAQGFADESAWARGQAWGLYGFVVCYRETGYVRYLRHAMKIAEFLLNHPNMPEDKIPYWDLNAPDIPHTYRDASAAAIMASALIELSDYADPQIKGGYMTAAETVIRSLSGKNYRSKPGENGNFLLKHGVGHLPASSEVDVPLSYADYYYLEAMMRWLKRQK